MSCIRLQELLVSVWSTDRCCCCCPWQEEEDELFIVAIIKHPRCHKMAPPHRHDTDEWRAGREQCWVCLQKPSRLVSALVQQLYSSRSFSGSIIIIKILLDSFRNLCADEASDSWIWSSDFLERDVTSSHTSGTGWITSPFICTLQATRGAVTSSPVHKAVVDAGGLSLRVWSYFDS